MEIKSYGVEQQVIPGYRGSTVDYFNRKLKEKVTDKKIKATYNILVRFKNNSKHSADCNNETLSLAFDTNLSTDFTHTEIDFAKGTSLTISLLESNQPRFGNTQLLILVQHINEAQELFQNIDYHYCPTPPGTITKRLEAYKKKFDEIVKQDVTAYTANGFKVNLAHTIRNFAGYLYYENKRRAVPFLSPIHAKLSINKILTLFSVFNEDFFWRKDERILMGSLHDSPYYDSDNAFENIHPTHLPIEQTEELERIINLMKSTSGIEQLLSDCHRNYKFEYEEFKGKFLALL